MNILVTGGAGYIGSHACLALREAGLNPVAYDNLVSGHEASALDWAFVKGDLSDIALLRKVFETYDFQAVMHFAAHAYVGESMRSPAKYFENNLIGGLNLLKVMKEAHVDKIIFSSTCAVYGDPGAVPIDEGHRELPVSPYGESKLFFEKILRRYEDAYGLKSISLRYFNAAGADSERRLGESHNPETHLIPLVLNAAKSKEEHVEIFGDDYDTPDGTCVRDFVHVTDLASAHVLALEKLDDDGRRPFYNLGSGKGYSVREVMKTARAVTGCVIEERLSARRPGDPPELIASADLARKELGWTPEMSDLRRIMETAWQWEQKRKF